MKHCPFKADERGINCYPECALWVKSEKMCSFRLLADNIAIDRKLARDAAAEAAQRRGPGP